MSIVKMKRISVAGMAEDRKDLIRKLQKLGAVEISNQDWKLSDPQWAQQVQKGDREPELTEIEVQLAKTRLAIETLERYDTAKKPLIFTRRLMDEDSFLQQTKQESALSSCRDEALRLREQLNQIDEQINQNNLEAAALAPWESFGVPLNRLQTAKTKLILGLLPLAVETGQCAGALQEEFPATAFFEISRDKSMIYAAVICLKEEEEDVWRRLRGFGFNRIALEEADATASQRRTALTAQVQEQQKSRETVLEALKGQAEHLPELQLLHDSLALKRDRCRAGENFLKTKKTFLLEGWIPAGCEDKASQILDSCGCWYEYREPQDGEEIPILLQNSSFATPFEAITQLYSLPVAGNIDPTKFFAPFYVMFFGIMLSDAGYGIVLALACALLLKKYRLEGMFQKMIRLFFYCGLSTVFWGAVFGGWFGDFFTVLGSMFGADIAIPPLWFNPLDNIMGMLVFSLIFGVIHLFAGMAVNAYLLIRDGHPFDAFCDVGLWYLLIGGIGVIFLGSSLGLAGVSQAGTYMAVGGAVGVLLTGGRHNKGIGKVTGGLGSLYNVTSYLSDVLSYSRLLALGLSTGVVAQVVNMMGSLAGDGIVGLIVLMIAFIIGHTFNMAVNLLGSFVHASRLQYVEFFGKFYEGGGEPFSPFRADTKYVNIVSEK